MHDLQRCVVVFVLCIYHMTGVLSLENVCVGVSSHRYGLWETKCSTGELERFLVATA